MSTTFGQKTVITGAPCRFRRGFSADVTDNTAFAEPFMQPKQIITKPGSYDLTKPLTYHTAAPTNGLNANGFMQHTSVNGQQCLIIPREQATRIHVMPFARAAGGTGQIFIGKASMVFSGSGDGTDAANSETSKLWVVSGMTLTFTASSAIAGVSSNLNVTNSDYFCDGLAIDIASGGFPGLNVELPVPGKANVPPASRCARNMVTASSTVSHFANTSRAMMSPGRPTVAPRFGRPTL